TRRVSARRANLFGGRAEAGTVLGPPTAAYCSRSFSSLTCFWKSRRRSLHDENSVGAAGTRLFPSAFGNDAACPRQSSHFICPAPRPLSKTCQISFAPPPDCLTCGASRRGQNVDGDTGKMDREFHAFQVGIDGKRLGNRTG